MRSSYSFLAVSSVLACYSAVLDAGELNLSFLQGGAKIDAAAWESLNNKYTPGRYLVDVVLNDKDLGKRIFTITSKDKDSICLTNEWLLDAGIVIEPQFYVKVFNTTRQCYVLDNEPNSHVDFDFSTQNVRFSLPQKGLLRQSATRPDWDYGISAIRLNYNTNANINDVGVDVYGATGITANLGKWVATTSMSVNQTKVDIPMINATRALQELNADLTLGKTFVSNSLAGSTSLLGMSLTSNSTMLPNKLGYTPVFSGIARTNARVTLIQNGSTVYSEIVPPGPFEIKNANLLSSGDVTMTVTESDGSVSTQLFPLTIVPNMLSPGESEYGVFAGLRENEGREKLDGIFTAVSYGYGFDNYTLKSSALLHGKYTNVGIGGVRGLGQWGTLAVQGAYSYGKYNDYSKRSGGKLSLTYAKTFSRDTSLQVASAQYTSENYTEFSDFMPWQRQNDQRKKQQSQYELSLTHRLADNIDVGLSGWHRRYWGDSETSIGFNSNVSARFEQFSLNLGSTYSQTGNGTGYGVSLSISVPFDTFSRKYNSYASVNITDDGSMSMNSGISSTLSENIDYSASIGWSHPNGDPTYSLQSSYRGDRVLLNTQLSQAGRNVTGSASVSGSAIILPTKRDIIFTRNTTDTIAIANVVNTEGVKFMSSPYPTNSKGNTIIPISGYNVNNITLDGSTLPRDKELLKTNITVVPTSGAVVYMPFSSITVKRYLLQIKDKNGKFVPNGTWARSVTGVPLGFISQYGVLFISSIDKPTGLVLGNCEISGTAIQDIHELQEVVCEN
ncbi:PefC/AfrB family outer membrane usher protein [Photobacterium kishitanii]|uniref:PefC/AfrB family outer membrane usher protein n=1 Tax=Photobacterium kishitanii TaxID=318456 RepID=UPI000D170A61|nr:PefC/AfrB family outer membrane usher protein [Photobacterium kishitanii]PSV09551.1 outer membrane usher protein PefC [Photobacterium kishitanii]